MASLKEGRRKRKKKTCPKEALEEAIFECEALVAKAKKPRKPADYQFHRDPITGARDIHTPYRQHFQPRIDPQMQPSLPLDGELKISLLLVSRQLNMFLLKFVYIAKCWWSLSFLGSHDNVFDYDILK